jgi:Lhr-like helicase
MRGELDLASYDQFFPAQDFLSAQGSIGNLIALPLQGKCRKWGTTVFLAPGVIQDIYRALVNDEQRNTAIIDDVQDAVRRGRHCLILTNRTAHMEHLAQRLQDEGLAPVLLHDKLGAKARRKANEDTTLWSTAVNVGQVRSHFSQLSRSSGRLTCAYSGPW